MMPDRRSSRRRHRRRSGRPCGGGASRAARHPPADFRARRRGRRLAARMGACAGLLAVALQHRRRRARAARGIRLAAPDADALPNGGEIVAHYLQAAGGAAGDRSEPEARRDGDRHHARGPRQGVVGRAGDSRPSSSAMSMRDGAEHRARARAVIDASGTWTQPNPIGVDGLSVPGEAAAAKRHRLWHSRRGQARARALCRQARPGRRRRPFGDQRRAGADGTAAGGAAHRDLLGAAPQQHRQAAWRRPQRRAARTRRARPCRQAGDGRRPAQDAGAVRGRAHVARRRWRAGRRRCSAASRSSSTSIASS